MRLTRFNVGVSLSGVEGTSHRRLEEAWASRRVRRGIAEALCFCTKLKEALMG